MNTVHSKPVIAGFVSTPSTGQNLRSSNCFGRVLRCLTACCRTQADSDDLALKEKPIYQKRKPDRKVKKYNFGNTNTRTHHSTRSSGSAWSPVISSSFFSSSDCGGGSFSGGGYCGGGVDCGGGVADCGGGF